MTYQFECSQHGVFDFSCGMDEVPRVSPCPACGKDAPRIYTVPFVIYQGKPGGDSGFTQADKVYDEIYRDTCKMLAEGRNRPPLDPVTQHDGFWDTLSDTVDEIEKKRHKPKRSLPSLTKNQENMLAKDRQKALAAGRKGCLGAPAVNQ